MEGCKFRLYSYQSIFSKRRRYDWWDLASAWGSGGEGGKGQAATGPHPTWVCELMLESDTRALPRSPEKLGRVLDSQEFWRTFDLSPVRARID